jgi:hypothetical protein
MSTADSYGHTIRQAARHAVHALLTMAPDSPEGSAALREVTARLAREHGPAAVLDLAEELAVDLAEALGAIAAVEQRDAVEVADRSFSDQPGPELPDSGADSARRDTESGPGRRRTPPASPRGEHPPPARCCSWIGFSR